MSFGPREMEVGTEKEIAEGKEFGEAKDADLERIRAILRRLRDSCQVVSFASGEDQEEF